jgi:hypothetical protein
MSSATLGTPPTGCAAPTPTLLSATPGHSEVALAWSDESGDPSVAGYRLYYDQAGKAQLVTDLADPVRTTYTDTGLTNGQAYCYKATAYYDATCESDYSGILCATPETQGQTGGSAGVDMMETGRYEVTGKGKDKITTFVLTDTFQQGDGVVIRARVTDASGNPISNATVEIQVGGPEQVSLNSNPSDAEGWAEASWQTQAPNRKGQGGTTPGSYTASTTNVTASGYNWDGVTTNVTFTLQ